MVYREGTAHGMLVFSSGIGAANISYFVMIINDCIIIFAKNISHCYKVLISACITLHIREEFTP